MKKTPEALKDIADNLPLTLSKQQVCDLLHVTRATFERAVRLRKLRVIKGPGRCGRVVVPRVEALRYMEERLR